MSERSALRPKPRIADRLAARHRRETAFRFAGLAATLLGVVFVGALFVSIIAKGYTAFVQTHLLLEVEFGNDREDIGAISDYDSLIDSALLSMFPEAADRGSRRDLKRLLSIDAGNRARQAVQGMSLPLPERVSVWVPASSNVDMLIKGRIDRDLDSSRRPLSDRQVGWIDELRANGRIERKFNTAFFSNGDSREAELAGIRGAVSGSLFMLVITLVLAFPTGVAAAIYLEEFAPKNRWTDLVEININNLAAVPSIVFGLLGLAIFIEWFGLPRSAPLVGGLVLALLTLPIVIITSRAAIKAVPKSLREAAAAMGASRMQMLIHHVLPLAMPGILTGTIIGLSRALGESAPLLMIGMVAFIVDVPNGFTDPATALPVQIFLWADSPDPAFAEKTSAAILVLLGFLMLMNLAAIVLRRRLEKSN